MRILIASGAGGGTSQGSAGKFYHLRDFGEALTKFDVEYKLVRETDYVVGFPTKQLRKYFASVKQDENYELSLSNLAESKSTLFDFFDNVMVKDADKTIQKNRLELLQMLCKTFDNYLNFSNIESS